MMRLGLLLLLASAGCASHYAYAFHVDEPAADPNLEARIAVDTVSDDIALELTNKTDQVLQVEWADIALTGAKGHVARLRPDADLGWIQPGATIEARLFPLALPREGDAAAAYEGQRFDLSVPVIVRREATVYHYSLVAHVRAL